VEPRLGVPCPLAGGRPVDVPLGVCDLDLELRLIETIAAELRRDRTVSGDRVSVRPGDRVSGKPY
jgi:hypothetical protein